jgi:hypothetical protein
MRRPASPASRRTASIGLNQPRKARDRFPVKLSVAMIISPK